MRTVTSRDGTKIAFEKSGQGAPVIFVGPALADRTAGAPLAEQLAKRFTAYIYDRRGRGDSGDTQPYAVQREVEDLAAMIEEAGGAAYVFGGSSGAVLALDAAVSGLAVKKLALYEPPIIVEEARGVPSEFVDKFRGLLASGRRSDAVDYYMTTLLRVPAEALGGMHKGPSWPTWEARAHTLVYDFTIMGDTWSGKPLRGDRWAALRTPTLVMDGGSSPSFMHTGAQALADLLPTVRRRTLAGQTHAVDVKILAGALFEFFVE